MFDKLEDKNTMKFMESIGFLADYIHLALKKEAVVVIVDKETSKVIRYLPGENIDIGYHEGDFVKSNDANLQSALNDRNSDIYLDANVYGMPINAYAFPIKENGRVVGAIGFGKPLDKEKQLEAYINGVRDIVVELQEKSHIIAAHSEELAATGNEIQSQSEKALEDSQKTNDITVLIKSISRQTNLLGLNASIEAARAGQHGAGFGIVAKEIRKLSQQTDDSTQQIDVSLGNIKTSLATLIENMNYITEASVEEAELAQDFTKIIENLDDISSKLSDFMKKMF